MCVSWKRVSSDGYEGEEKLYSSMGVDDRLEREGNYI